MSRVKLKLFVMWGCPVSSIVSTLQAEIDRWAEGNVEIQILNSELSISDGDIIIIIKYYESKKRDLILEKTLKE